MKEEKEEEKEEEEEDVVVESNNASSAPPAGWYDIISCASNTPGDTCVPSGRTSLPGALVTWNSVAVCPGTPFLDLDEERRTGHSLSVKL